MISHSCRFLALAFFVAAPAFASFDHVAAIKGLDATDLTAGQKFYTQHCVACHGADGNLTQNPLARRFAQDELKFGADPYSLWKTVSYGNGLMFRWDAVLHEKQRYQIVHYIRETFLRRNGTQYILPDAGYFAELPERADADARAHGHTMPESVPAAGLLDGRMGQAMLYGPAQSHSLQFDAPKDEDAVRSKGTTERAMLIALPGGAAIGYDTARFSVAGLWRKKLVGIEDTHHGSYKGKHALTPGDAPIYTDVDADGWRVRSSGTAAKPATIVFNGHYLHGERVVLAYTVAGRRVLEAPGADPKRSIYTRDLEIAAGSETIECLVGRIPGGNVKVSGAGAAIVSGARALHAAVLGASDGLTLRGDESGALWVTIPSGKAARRITVAFGFDSSIPTTLSPASPDISQLVVGGPRRWTTPVLTSVIRGKSIDGYAADEFLVPFANPWGSWMRLSGIDFLSDGRIAVSTLSGDVWIVTVNGDELSWSRFANGLYEPLGLRIVDDAIYVRCRERIVRLHDFNRDGEADYYESFYNEPGEIGTGYHAFIFELQTDRSGNFYYSKSGRKAPHKAAIVRVSPDGTRAETMASDMRHPNGMGVGGPRDWITVADNPGGKAIYNGVALVREGASLGYERPRNTPMLAALPAVVDASSTGQCWSDARRWGPLSGSLLHTSYSHCAMFYVMVQDVGAHPNGFAVRLPFGFKAGLMRSRVNPTDGQVYTVGLKGWDTHAAYDGCLYRIRHTDEPSRLIHSVAATHSGLRMAFTCDLDRATITTHSVVATREAGKKGEVVSVTLGPIALIGQRTLEIAMPEIEHERVERRTTKDSKGNVMVDVRSPIALTVSVKSADGHAINQIIYATINSLP